MDGTSKFDKTKSDVPKSRGTSVAAPHVAAKDTADQDSSSERIFRQWFMNASEAELDIWHNKRFGNPN